MSSTDHIFTRLDQLDPAGRVSLLANFLDWLGDREIVVASPQPLAEDATTTAWRGGARWRDAIDAEFAEVINDPRIYPASAFPEVAVSVGDV